MARECQEDKKTPIPPWVLKRALWSAHTAQPTALTSMPHGKSLTSLPWVPVITESNWGLGGAADKAPEQTDLSLVQAATTQKLEDPGEQPPSSMGH